MGNFQQTGIPIFPLLRSYNILPPASGGWGRYCTPSPSHDTFTGHITFWGYAHPIILPLVPCPFCGWGYRISMQYFHWPQLLSGGTPAMTGWGYPPSRRCWGTPPILDTGVPQLELGRWAVPPIQLLLGFQPPNPGEVGVPLYPGENRVPPVQDRTGWGTSLSIGTGFKLGQVMARMVCLLRFPQEDFLVTY